jgi:hypothetical protein
MFHLETVATHPRVTKSVNPRAAVRVTLGQIQQHVVYETAGFGRVPDSPDACAKSHVTRFCFAFIEGTRGSQKGLRPVPEPGSRGGSNRTQRPLAGFVAPRT